MGPTDVRFTPKSGHGSARLGCPLCAISGHRENFHSGAAKTAKPLARRVTSGFAFVPNVPVWVGTVGLSNRQRPCPSAQEGTCPVRLREKLTVPPAVLRQINRQPCRKKAVAFDRDQIVEVSIRPRGPDGRSCPTTRVISLVSPRPTSAPSPLRLVPKIPPPPPLHPLACVAREQRCPLSTAPFSSWS